MKKLALTLIVSGLLAGAAFAADPKQGLCPADCCNGSQPGKSVFKSLAPEYEIEVPFGG